MSKYLKLLFRMFDEQWAADRYERRKAETLERNELKKELKRLRYVKGWKSIGAFFGFKDRRTCKKYLFANPFITFTGTGRGTRVTFGKLAYYRRYGLPIIGWKNILRHFGRKDFRAVKRRLLEERRLDYIYGRPIVHVPIKGVTEGSR
ncbi:MAG: hypothetical protein HQK99_16240 [Nitrospirae bacterium]|nr:hypothetical protein [Nitrospirota bacterium]